MIVPGGMNSWHGMVRVASKVRHCSDVQKMSDTERKLLITGDGWPSGDRGQSKRLEFKSLASSEGACGRNVSEEDR